MPITEGVLTITPEDVIITNHLWDAFGQYETEISAEWLVRFAQDRKEGWKPFTYLDIEKFYSRSGKHSEFGFNRLLTGGWIKESLSETGVGSLYNFTEEFISRVYKSSTRT